MLNIFGLRNFRSFSDFFKLINFWALNMVYFIKNNAIIKGTFLEAAPSLSPCLKGKMPSFDHLANTIKKNFFSHFFWEMVWDLASLAPHKNLPKDVDAPEIGRTA